MKNIDESRLESDLGKDPHLANAVATAFPQRLVDIYPDEVREHRLHREIMCTQIANDIINRMGLNFIQRQRKATGAPVADVARAYASVMDIFGVSEVWEQVEQLDHSVDAQVQMEMMVNLIRLVKRTTRWLLRNRRHELTPTRVIAEFSDGVAQLRGALPTLLRGRSRAAQQYKSQYQYYIEQGVDETLAATVAATLQAYTALGIIQAAVETHEPLLDVAQVYYVLGERLELDWFSSQILDSKIDNEWQAMARDTYLEDLEWQQRTLAVGVLRHMCEDRDLLKCLSTWQEHEAPLIKRWQEMLTELHATSAPDFAMFAVDWLECYRS